jgi:hypothetical protein
MPGNESQAAGLLDAYLESQGAGACVPLVERKGVACGPRMRATLSISTREAVQPGLFPS